MISGLVLLHTIGGSGPWDEVLVLGMIGLFMLVLLGLGYRSSRRRRPGKGKGRGPGARRF